MRAIMLKNGKNVKVFFTKLGKVMVISLADLKKIVYNFTYTNR